ncbi:MAG: holo-ACP synthase [Candidatus Thorarchaeota archaeon]
MSLELGSSIGIGLDIAEVNRFRSLGVTHPFFTRVFTVSERDYCMTYSDPFPHFAGLFAAKEAVVKALSHQAHLPLQSVEIHHSPSGSPQVRVPVTIARSIILSISHSGQYAVAVALSLKPNGTIDPDELQLMIETLATKVLPMEVTQSE